MTQLLQGIKSWRWPSTLVSFLFVLYGIHIKEYVPHDAAMEMFRLICVFMLVIVTLTFLKLNVIKLGAL